MKPMILIVMVIIMITMMMKMTISMNFIYYFENGGYHQSAFMFKNCMLMVNKEGLFSF